MEDRQAGLRGKDRGVEWHAALEERGLDRSGEPLELDELARQAGREPDAILHSACVLVVLDRDAGERPLVEKAPPLEGSPEAVASFLTDLAAAGADEAILVASPINEQSIRLLGRALAVLDA